MTDPVSMSTALRRFPFQALGGLCEIQFLDRSRIDARKRLKQLLAEVTRLENKYAHDLPDNPLSEINAMAGNNLGVRIDSETFELLSIAMTRYEQSDGRLDITASRLQRLWLESPGTPPDPEAIDKLLPHIGMDRLSLGKSRLVIPPDMEINFGDLVKQYAADSLASMARNLGLDNGLVNLGGVFAVIGPLPTDRPWPIGFRHVVDGKPTMGRLLLPSGGIATSGDFDRSIEYQGQHYSAVINTSTGLPWDGLLAVSVCDHSCVDAGTAAALASIKPAPDAIAWLESLNRDFVYLDNNRNLAGRGFDIVAEPEPSAQP